MPLRFFADHCTPGFVVRTLQSTGQEVYRLRDYIPTDSDDVNVIAKAQELDAILLSLNGDFADIVTYPPAHYKGIIGLQIRGHPEILPQITSRLTEYLAGNPDANHYHGKLILVEAHRVRIRK